MTSSEIEIQRNKNKRDDLVQRSHQESALDGHDENALLGESSVPHSSTRSERQDPMLKSMIDRDTKKNSRYGNAIEKQKNRALSSTTTTAAPGQTAKNRAAPQEVYVPQEYEYHTNRILIAVIIGLVVISLLGWGLFMMFRGEAPAETTRFTAENYAEQTTEAAPTSTEADSMDALKNAIGEASTQPLSEGNKPSGLDAPAQPAFNQAASATQKSSPQQTPAVAQQDAQPTVPAQTQASVETPSTSVAPEVANTQAKISASVPAEGSGILIAEKVARTTLARGVKNFEPIGVYQSQDISLEGRNSFRLFWFTQLTNLNGQTVSHRWYYNDVLAADIQMNIGSVSWRTTSNKQVDQNTLGAWRVEAVDSTGQVLARQYFNIVK